MHPSSLLGHTRCRLGWDALQRMRSSPEYWLQLSRWACEVRAPTRSRASTSRLFSSTAKVGTRRRSRPPCRRWRSPNVRLEHPQTLFSVNNLAALYASQERYGEAAMLLMRAIEASARTLGEEHPDSVAVVNNLAALYFEERDWARAVQLWRRGAKRALSDERPLQELVALGLNQLIRFRGGAFAKR